MLDACKNAIQLQQYETLKEIVLRYPYMRQIYRSLPMKDFQTMVKNMSYYQTSSNKPFRIDYKSLYLFFDAGSINKREKQSQSQGNFRIKLKNKTDIYKIGTKNTQLKQNILYEIRQYDCYNDINGYITNSRLNNNYFYPFLNKNALILYCPFERLSEATINRLKDIHNEKLRYLYSLPIFKNIQRDVLQENIYKFKFSELSFGSIRLISKYQESIFLKDGSLQVASFSKAILSHQVYAKSIIRYDENYDIHIKGNSENTVFYYIKQSEMQYIISLAKNTIASSNQKLLVYANYPNQPQERQKQNSPSQLSYCAHSSIKRRLHQRSHGQLTLGLKQQKKISLKKHFSNFYNEIFQQFSKKKIKQMGMDINSDEKLILYQIKMLQQKLPNMQQINRKLHRMRQQRIKKCKLTMSSTCHLKELKNVGVSVL